MEHDIYWRIKDRISLEIQEYTFEFTQLEYEAGLGSNLNNNNNNNKGQDVRDKLKQAGKCSN